MPSARMRAASSVATAGSGCSLSVMAPRRCSRRTRRLALAGSKVMSSLATIRSAKRASISASVIGAAKQMRPDARASGQLGHREERFARKRRLGVDLRAAAVGQQECAGGAAPVFGDALRIGEGQKRAGAYFLAIRWGRGSECGFACLRPTLCHRASFAAAGRAVAAKSIEPMRQVHVVAGKAALADQDRDFGGRQRRAFVGGVDDHAREPRRQRQLPQLSSLVGDAAVAIDSAKLGQQRFRFGERRTRRRIEERELVRRPSPTPPDRARRTTDRRTGFPAGKKLQAKPSVARPTAGSRRRARSGRRGRGADRLRRATLAPFRAASPRHRARSAARARARYRRPCARPGW